MTKVSKTFYPKLADILHRTKSVQDFLIETLLEVVTATS